MLQNVLRASALTAGVMLGAGWAGSAVAQTVSAGGVTPAPSAENTADSQIAIGTNSDASSGPSTVAVGVDAVAGLEGATAVGSAAEATGYFSSSYGGGAAASGNYSSAFGYGASASGAAATAVGEGATVSGNYSSALGAGATASANNTTAVGDTAGATAQGASAFGYNARATGQYSMASGYQANASGTGAIAVGQYAQASGAGSVSVGSGSSATADNSVALGAGSTADRANTVSVGAAGAERQITNVAAGVEDTDAVNVSQLKAVQASVGDLRDESRHGIAAAMAMTAVPMPSAPGKIAWALNGANFKDAYAGGVSAAYRFNTATPFVASASVGYAGSKAAGVRIGVSGEF